MRNNKLIAAVLVLQGLILLGQWGGQPAMTREARADITLPDPGARQLAMVEELKSLNGKMERLIGLLQSGDVQVKVAKDKDGEQK
jgi:hypothetical protein